MAKDSASGNRLIANNKKAYYDYFIEDNIEAGMSCVEQRLSLYDRENVP